MGATEEQMSLLAGAGVTHVSYILILYSFAFILYLFVNVLLHLYATYAWPTERAKPEKDNSCSVFANRAVAEAGVEPARGLLPNGF